MTLFRAEIDGTDSAPEGKRYLGGKADYGNLFESWQQWIYQHQEWYDSMLPALVIELKWNKSAEGAIRQI